MHDYGRGFKSLRAKQDHVFQQVNRLSTEKERFWTKGRALESVVASCDQDMGLVLNVVQNLRVRVSSSEAGANSAKHCAGGRNDKKDAFSAG